MKRIAVYPGTFDPITLGHVDVIERATRLFDEVIVGVATSDRKQPLFDAKTRWQMCVESLVDLPNCQVVLLDGLLVDFAKAHGVNFVVRGIRTADDVTYELANAHMNQQLSAGTLQTVFVPGDTKHIYVSATMVREIMALGGDVSGFVPKAVVQAIG